MEKESAPKKQFRLKKKTFFLLFLIFVAILLSAYFLFFYSKNESSDELSEEESGPVETVEVFFTDEDKSNYDPMSLSQVEIVSTGEIYEEDLTVGGKPVKLFILKSLYSDIQGVERELDVVVGILFDGSYENILNWWTYNLIIDEIDIDSLGNKFFEKSYLESIFGEGTSWEYLYYSGPDIPVSTEYLEVVKVLLGEEVLENLEEKIVSGESEGLILMPCLIYEN